MRTPALLSATPRPLLPTTPQFGAASHNQQLITSLEWALRRIRVSIAYADEGEYFRQAEATLAAAKASRGCPTCAGNGIHRPPYAREAQACPDCRHT